MLLPVLLALLALWTLATLCRVLVRAALRCEPSSRAEALERSLRLRLAGVLCAPPRLDAPPMLEALSLRWEAPSVSPRGFRRLLS